VIHPICDPAAISGSARLQHRAGSLILTAPPANPPWRAGEEEPRPVRHESQPNEGWFLAPRIPAAFRGVTGLKGTYGRVPRPAGRPLAQLTVAGVIGAELADTVLATSIASGPVPRDPAALPQWPVPATAGVQLTVGFSADLGYARPDAAGGRPGGRTASGAGSRRDDPREVAVRLANRRRGGCR
jgi:hypothetical protein